MEKYGIKISNYKCFNEPIGFEEIKPINVIIGKNNIGKSSLIDMIEFHYNASKYCDECKKNTNLKLIINKELDENDLDGSKVQKELLNRLNEIMGDSYNFTNIVVQTIEDKDNLVWEIFLDEENKGRIALSQSGSELKTIILLLIFTILIPALEKKTLDNYIFILEE